jgi:hypothetical protein
MQVFHVHLHGWSGALSNEKPQNILGTARVFSSYRIGARYGWTALSPQYKENKETGGTAAGDGKLTNSKDKTGTRNEAILRGQTVENGDSQLKTPGRDYQNLVSATYFALEQKTNTVAEVYISRLDSLSQQALPAMRGGADTALLLLLLPDFLGIGENYRFFNLGLWKS